MFASRILRTVLSVLIISGFSKQAFSLSLPTISFQSQNISTGNSVALTNGKVLTASAGKIQITALVSSSAAHFDYIVFNSSLLTTARTEHFSPFTLFPQGDARVIPIGSYQITATAYNEQTHAAVAKSTLNFRVTAPFTSVVAPQIGFQLVDPQADSIVPLTNNSIIQKGDHDLNIKLALNNFDGYTIGMVKITGSKVKAVTDNIAPFFVLRDDDSLKPGSQSVSASVYTSQGTKKKTFQASLRFGVMTGGDLGTSSVGSSSQSWASSFENGFPAEWMDYNNGSYSTNDSATSMGDHWTFWNPPSDSSVQPLSGSYVYKGVIEGDARGKDGKHRPYPVKFFDAGAFQNQVATQFSVFMNRSDFDNLNDAHAWLHLATYASNTWWDVSTLCVTSGRDVVLGHTDWTKTKYYGPDGNSTTQAPQYPWGRWVRFTVVLDYRSDGKMVVWMDGKKRIYSTGGALKVGGDSLLRAHWGLYSEGYVKRGTQYVDDIHVWNITNPLTDFNAEPIAPVN